MEEKSSRYLARYNQMIHECDSAYHRAATRFGLSDTAFWILYVICLLDRDLTQKEICDLLFLPKQTVHSALKGLLEQEILELRAGAGRREKRIHVTPKGNQFLRGTVDQVLAAERAVFSRVPEADMEQFLRTCRRITEELIAELDGAAEPETLGEKVISE